MRKEKIVEGKTYLGIELGSTRIKACLIDDTFTPVASGSYEWENSFENGYWTYSLQQIHQGVKSCYQNLKERVFADYGVRLNSVGAIGVSAMMHGYLAFDKEGRLLVPFRTWRNTTTEKAAKELTELFQFNIPQRWSIAHLYQAILDGEPHVPQIAHITTLAGYIHFLLTGRRELGIGDASGMFPVTGRDYDETMLQKFRQITKERGYTWDIGDLLPKVRCAGEQGAFLTEEGAAFLDPEGELEAGVPLCPPEGDAGTGMAATNAVLPKTGNVSAGTSVFSMLVLENPLKELHPEIDMVTAPDGAPVAMVHCNNCCGELDAWVGLFGEFASLAGISMDKSKLYDLLYRHALSDEKPLGGIVAYNYLSGEHVTKITSGRPMYFRLPECKMSLAGFMRAQLYAALATLKIGMDILFEKEKVRAERFLAHGGLFKVEGVAQQILASALKTPVSVMQTAGEGGAWGMALLAAYAYMMEQEGESLGQWLSSHVFSDRKVTTLQPQKRVTLEFEEFMTRYQAGLDAQKKLEEVR